MEGNSSHTLLFHGAPCDKPACIGHNWEDLACLTLLGSIWKIQSSVFGASLCCIYFGWILSAVHIPLPWPAFSKTNMGMLTRILPRIFSFKWIGFVTSQRCGNPASVLDGLLVCLAPFRRVRKSDLVFVVVCIRFFKKERLVQTFLFCAYIQLLLAWEHMDGLDMDGLDLLCSGDSLETMQLVPLLAMLNKGL